MTVRIVCAGDSQDLNDMTSLPGSVSQGQTADPKKGMVLHGAYVRANSILKTGTRQLLLVRVLLYVFMLMFPL